MSDKFRDSLKQLKVSDTQGLPYELFLNISARYLMTINNDTSDGLVKGATGILHRIEYGTRREAQARVPCILCMSLMIQLLERKSAPILKLVTFMIILS